MSLRVLWKAPGEPPSDIRLNMGDDQIRQRIGSTFQTYTLENRDWEQGSIVLICADQEAARAHKFENHISFPTGAIAGPVIIARKRHRGDYLNLTDGDAEAWTVNLLVFAQSVGQRDEQSQLTRVQKQQILREHYAAIALRYPDDLTAVIRLQVELEHQIRDRLQGAMKYPERISTTLRFELPQLVSIAAAADAIPGDSVDIINALGHLRNRYAHVPGFIPSAQDLKRLTEVAPKRGPYDDFDYIFASSTEGSPGLSDRLSQESIVIRGLYQSAILDVQYRWDIDDELEVA